MPIHGFRTTALAEFVTIAGNNAIAIESQEVGIGPNETDGIGRARQILHPAFFDGADIDRSNAQLSRDRVRVLAQFLAPTSQQATDTHTCVLNHALHRPGRVRQKGLYRNSGPISIRDWR